MLANEFELYDKKEEHNWWYRGRRSILKSVLSSIENKHEKQILEVGCGTGGNLKYLFNGFKRISGLEIDSLAIEFAEKKLTNVEIIRGDANKLDEIHGRYDVVAFCDVLYHFKVISTSSTLLKTREILSRGGYILITDGAFNFLNGQHSRNVGCARRFTRSELESILHKAGYEVVRASYWGIIIFILLFIKRVILEKVYSTKEEYSESHDIVSIPIFDNIMEFFLSIEAALIRVVSLPIGASVVILAKKKA